VAHIIRRGIKTISRTAVRELGWVRGCYDSVPDDGACYRHSPLLLGAFEGLSHEEVLHLYQEGYREGRISRLV
jgi:hypothetical protein